MKYLCALVEALDPVAAQPPADQRIWLIFQQFLVLFWAVLIALRNAKWSDKNVRAAVFFNFCFSLSQEMFSNTRAAETSGMSLVWAQFYLTLISAFFVPLSLTYCWRDEEHRRWGAEPPSLTSVWFHGLPWWLSVKESVCNAGATGNMGLIPGSGRSPGGGYGNSLQYSCLENPHGQRNLVGDHPWGCWELDRTETT